MASPECANCQPPRTAPLPPGEYAFLSQVDLDRWQKYPVG